MSVTGAELPLYYEFDNSSLPERIVEIIKHASGRDAAFYFAGFFSFALVGAVGCVCLVLRKRWLVRRQYTRQMEHELETVDGDGEGGGVDSI